MREGAVLRAVAGGLLLNPCGTQLQRQEPGAEPFTIEQLAVYRKQIPFWKPGRKTLRYSH